MSQEGIGVRLGVLGVRRVKDDDMKGEKLLEKIAELEGFDVFIYCIYIYINININIDITYI